MHLRRRQQVAGAGVVALDQSRGAILDDLHVCWIAVARLAAHAAIERSHVLGSGFGLRVSFAAQAGAVGDFFDRIHLILDRLILLLDHDQLLVHRLEFVERGIDLVQLFVVGGASLHEVRVVGALEFFERVHYLYYRVFVSHGISLDFGGEVGDALREPLCDLALC